MRNVTAAVVSSGRSKHRYWRIYISRLPDDVIGSYVMAKEIEMREFIGGSDQCTGGTASASTVYDASYVAAYAFDNGAAEWCSKPLTWDAGIGVYTVSEWIAYDFSVPRAVCQIAYTAASSVGGWGAYYSPRDFLVQYSDDGSNWYTAASFSGYASWTDGETKLFTI